MRFETFRTVQRTPRSTRVDEQGWALLGLILALGVMSIVLASSIVPNVQMQVQRDKEVEMMYRGEQMAEGIARYYGRGRVMPLQIQLLLATPLTELAKLRDGITIGVNERKLVRPSAMIDPISNSEWEPVRARDPRIAKFLQAWAAQTLNPIPRSYLDLAAPPQKSAFEKKSSPSSPLQPPSSETSEQSPPIVNPANPGNRQIKPPGQPVDPDDDDDDDDEPNDPLAHLFQSSSGPGQSNVPIVGVAPKKKGKAANAYFGLENYEEWVFIFIPKTGLGIPPPAGQPTRPQVSN